MKRLNPQDLELYNFVDEVLFYIWDPIGVSEFPDGRSEYRSYLPSVFALLKESKSKKEIADHLFKIEVERMGLGTAPDAKAQTLKVAKILIDYKDWVGRKYS